MLSHVKYFYFELPETTITPGWQCTLSQWGKLVALWSCCCKRSGVLIQKCHTGCDFQSKGNKKVGISLCSFPFNTKMRKCFQETSGCALWTFPLMHLVYFLNCVVFRLKLNTMSAQKQSVCPSVTSGNRDGLSPALSQPQSQRKTTICPFSQLSRPSVRTCSCRTVNVRSETYRHAGCCRTVASVRGAEQNWRSSHCDCFSY